MTNAETVALYRGEDPERGVTLKHLRNAVRLLLQPMSLFLQFIPMLSLTSHKAMPLRRHSAPSRPRAAIPQFCP